MKTGRTLGLLVGIAATGTLASADLSDVIFCIDVEGENGRTGRVELTEDMGTWDGDTFVFADGKNQRWRVRADQGQTLAILKHVRIRINNDPVVGLNFNVFAGNQNSLFTVTAPTLSFSPIASPQGAATAAVTVTDLNGDGATLTPVSGGMYLAQYNGAVPNGTTFTTLLANQVVAAPLSTNTQSQSVPFSLIGGNVFDMSARWQFTLSAGDIASGTSSYVVTPAPASLALLGVGGLVAGRRRR